MDLTGWISSTFSPTTGDSNKKNGESKLTEEVPQNNYLFGVLPLGFSNSEVITDIPVEEPDVVATDKTLEGPWDYCLVFKNDEIGEDQFEQSEIGKATYYALLEAGGIKFDFVILFY